MPPTQRYSPDDAALTTYLELLRHGGVLRIEVARRLGPAELVEPSSKVIERGAVAMARLRGVARRECRAEVDLVGWILGRRRGARRAILFVC